MGQALVWNPWREGTHRGAIVVDCPYGADCKCKRPYGSVGVHTEQADYGGHLICESISDPAVLEHILEIHNRAIKR